MPVRGDSADLTLTVVDDDPLVLEMLVRAARSWHYQCQTATSAEQALEILEKRVTPIVVTDLNMPGRGGIWLVREIQKRWPDVATIVVTAGYEKDAAIECLNAGADRYFLKPIKLEDFRRALEATMDTYQVQREHQRYRDHLEKTVKRQTRQVRRTFLSAIDSLVRTLEARDPYTTGHSLRVKKYSLRLAAALGLNLKNRRLLSLAAKMHDIGKVGVPDAILNKPGFLNEEEIRVVRKHPVIGERILAPIIRNKDVLAAIRGHHERVDGTGYPDGLGGSRIPLLARIITVADCFDAMTTSRAYRAALSMGRALEILREGSGTQFEPSFVHAFIEGAIPAITLNGDHLLCHGTALARDVSLPALDNPINYLSKD